MKSRLDALPLSGKASGGVDATNFFAQLRQLKKLSCVGKMRRVRIE